MPAGDDKVNTLSSYYCQYNLPGLSGSISNVLIHYKAVLNGNHTSGFHTASPIKYSELICSEGLTEDYCVRFAVCDSN